MAPSKKPVLPPLKTPNSPSFPSELHDSPLFSAKAGSIKLEDSLKTPITPPAAYTDFLKTLTPVLASPAPSSACNTEKTFSFESQPSTATGSYFCNCSSNSHYHKSPAPLSATTATSPVVHHHHHHHYYRSDKGRTDKGRRTPTSLRPLRVPSASPKQSPISQSPRCCSARSPLPPTDWPAPESGVRYIDASRCSSCARPVSVRHVITKTITYKRTPLEPAPKGKRRKTEDKK